MDHVSLGQQYISSLLGFMDQRSEGERIETSVFGRGKGIRTTTIYSNFLLTPNRPKKSILQD